MKILVTGGAGFIGSNFIRYMFDKHSDIEIVNLDKLTYAGNLDNLKEIEKDKRYQFVKGDICDPKVVDRVVSNGVNVIINFAAESHVDRSIDQPGAFIQTDVFGTYVLLEAVKKYELEKYVQISTDEVYGDWEKGGFAKETDLLHPSSPYSASKAGGDLQALAYHRTFGLPVVITRCTNNYGPYQYPEKIVPLFVTNAIDDQKLPVYGDGRQIRDWIYVDDHCSAVDLVLEKGKLGEIYNIGANQDPEVPNVELTDRILKILNKPDSLKEYIKDRAGHDRRYAVDCTKIKDLGWKAETDIESGLNKTVEWYQRNEWWWRKIKSGEFLEYYKKQYEQR